VGRPKDISLESVHVDTYELDQTHVFITFSVFYGGLSDYVVNLIDVKASLQFDPMKLE